MKKHCDDNFAFYSGDDETACEFILNGGKMRVRISYGVEIEEVPDQAVLGRGDCGVRARG